MARARMAVSTKSEYKSLIDVLVKAVQRDGFRGLYRGYTPTVMGVIPYAGFGFFTYETLKRFHYGEHLVYW